MVASETTSRWPAVVGLVAGVVILLSAAAHARSGWDTYAALVRDPETAANVERDVVGGLYAGWIWGSFAMAAFGCIVLRQAWCGWRRRAVDRAVVAAISLAFGGFGTWAYALRGQPHFLAFLVTGGLVAVLLLCKPISPHSPATHG